MNNFLFHIEVEELPDQYRITCREPGTGKQRTVNTSVAYRTTPSLKRDAISDLGITLSRILCARMFPDDVPIFNTDKDGRAKFAGYGRDKINTNGA